MAIYRHVHVDFWKDPKVLEELTPEEKLFFLYLLTNQNTTQIGVYKITKKQIAFELGFSTEVINSLMDRFINNYKRIKYNNETREIAIKNWGKYNLNELGRPMLDCVKSELKTIDDKSLLEFIKPSISKEEIISLFDEIIYFDKNYDTCNDTYNVTYDDTYNDRYDDTYNDTCTYRGQNKKEKEKENKNKKENMTVGEIKNGNDIKTFRECKYTTSYQGEDEYYYKKPTKEQLRYARSL